MKTNELEPVSDYMKLGENSVGPTVLQKSVWFSLPHYNTVCLDILWHVKMSACFLALHWDWKGPHVCWNKKGVMFLKCNAFTPHDHCVIISTHYFLKSTCSIHFGAYDILMCCDYPAEQNWRSSLYMWLVLMDVLCNVWLLCIYLLAKHSFNFAFRNRILFFLTL